MIAEVKSNFLGSINDVDFYNREEYMIAVETINILEKVHDKNVLDKDTVVNVKNYISESMSEEVLLSTTRGCLRTFARSSKSLEDFNLRLGTTSEYGSALND